LLKLTTNVGITLLRYFFVQLSHFPVSFGSFSVSASDPSLSPSVSVEARGIDTAVPGVDRDLTGESLRDKGERGRERDEEHHVHSVLSLSLSVLIPSPYLSPLALRSRVDFPLTRRDTSESLSMTKAREEKRSQERESLVFVSRESFRKR
jgi:hypothetical protein